ncbi:sporulation peptidase YabG [Paenibacillus turicensis]|uniref:sporulation peptidase YabG n=1 Tax=Paenibacillus turicensis TaxID=160487 RepID=UPI003D2BD248
MKLGDWVVRRSYGGDITFRVEELDARKAIIKGTEFRLMADAPINDLIKVELSSTSERGKRAIIKATESMERLHEERLELMQRNQEVLQAEWKLEAKSDSYFEVPGKVLHLDGDERYLKKSLSLYEQLHVPAHGYYVNETQMASALSQLLPKIRPDVVVITGHDGVLKNRPNNDLYNLSSYKHSIHFMNAVEEARKYERNFDALTVIAGACQSHFEALLQAGANFASSPARVLIHALDPVYVAARASFTSIRDAIPMREVLNNTISGLQGIGGIETRGSYRMGFPRFNDLSKLNVVPSQ